MKTFDRALKDATIELEAAGVPEAELNAWYLIEEAVRCFVEEKASDADNVKRNYAGFNRAWFMLHREEEIPEAIEDHLHSLSEYRKKRIPLEYLTHRTEFMGLTFSVDGRVLIPRQDTEILVEEALNYAEGADVLDLCTGSGCIAVSLAVLGKCRSVTASDVSAEALAVARENAGIHEVSFIHSDLWEEISGTYDLITCNPPYIPRDVIPTLMPEVQDYEPVMALDGGEDGLDFYRRIMAKIGTFLRKDGHLIVEIGYDQGEAVATLMREAGLADVQVKQDLAGLDRIVIGRREV